MSDTGGEVDPEWRHVSGDAARDEFHRHLGRLVHAMARFDFNLGLQLNWMGPYLGTDVSEALDPTKAQLRTRLRRLKSLVLRGYAPAGDKALRAFRSWFERADRARAIRNDYVHGRWGVPAGYEQDAEGRRGAPLIAFVPLNWNLQPDQPDQSIQMTMREFAAQVDVAERLTHEYFELEERYKAHFVCPGAAAP